MSIVTKTTLAVSSLLAVAAMQLPAHADTLYDWSLTSPGGAGSITTPLSGTLDVNSGDFVDSITVNGFSYASPIINIGGDNEIYPAGNATTAGGFLDGAGLEFVYGASSASTTDVNIYYQGGDMGNDYAELVGTNDALVGGFTLTATPLPASWSMILTGLAFVAFFAYRRSSKTGNTFA